MLIFHSLIIGSVELTAERQSHILNVHPELKSHLDKISVVLSEPDEIRRSRFDKNVLLFHKFFTKVKSGGRNFVLTSYITDKIRAGEKYETEKQ